MIPMIELTAAALMAALAVAVLAPPPLRNKDGVLAPLLATILLTTLLMGVLALTGRFIGTAILAAAAAMLLMPCAWLVRAPWAAEGAWQPDEEEDEDDGGGSPSPFASPPPAGPDGLRSERRPAAVLAMSPAPMSAPVLASAGPRAALGEPEAAPRNPAFPLRAAPPWAGGEAPPPSVTDVPSQLDAPAPLLPLNPRFPLVLTEPWTEPHPTPAAPASPAPRPAATPALPTAERPRRGDHRSIIHRRAPAEHPGRRRGPKRGRLLHSWRRWRWFAGAECADHTAAPRAYAARAHGADAGRQARAYAHDESR